MAENELIIKVKAQTKEFNESIGGLKNSISQIGDQLKIALVGMSGAGIGAVKVFADFENEMIGVKTLLDENSFSAKTLDDGFKDMQAQIRALARTSPIDLGKSTKALFDMVSAGVDADEAVTALGASAKLSTAGLTDISRATDGITTALNSYGIASSDAELVAAKLFSTQKRGKTTIAELSQFIGLAAANAQAAGVSFDELLAATAAVTAGGVKTGQAFTGLKAILANVAKPTKDAAEEAKRLGIEFDFTALSSKGLSKFLTGITSSSKFTKESLVKLFGSVEAQTVAFSLAGKQAKNFNTILGELGNKTKVTETLNRAYSEQSRTLTNQLIILRNKFYDLAITIGGKLAPTITQISSFFSAFADKLNTDESFANTIVRVIKLSAAILAMGIAIKALSPALSLAGKSFIIFGSVLKSIGTLLLTTPIGRITTLVILLGVTIYNVAKDWNNNWKLMLQTFSWFGEKFGEIITGIGAIITGDFSYGINLIKNSISDMASYTFSELKLWSSNTASSVSNTMTSMFSATTDGLTKSFDALSNNLDKSAEKTSESAEKTSESSTSLLESVTNALDASFSKLTKSLTSSFSANEIATKDSSDGAIKHLRAIDTKITDTKTKSGLSLTEIANKLDKTFDTDMGNLSRTFATNIGKVKTAHEAVTRSVNTNTSTITRQVNSSISQINTLIRKQEQALLDKVGSRRISINSATIEQAGRAIIDIRLNENIVEFIEARILDRQNLNISLL